MKTGLIAILLFLAVQTAWGQFCLHSGMARKSRIAINPVFISFIF